jgi:uncharacterized protein YbbC (DUF1343 family)
LKLAAVLAASLVAAFGPEASPDAAPRVLAGLDVIARDGPGALRGKRVGLIAHAASVTADGRRALDVLRAQGLDVLRVFAPEHGVAGTRAAGERFGDEKDAATGVPIFAMYGKAGGLDASDVKGLDALVFDLQDVGVRFYTYASDVMLALETAAANGVELVVLDRPNPLGGDRLEGPVSDPRLPRTAVNRAPGPLVHGLTIGELARYVNARRDRPARLTVVPLRGWTRAMTWGDTGRAWVPPSPNLRTAEAALAYPGTCLLEATNASEGRGTEAPFLLIGAPWMDAEALRRRVSVPGFALEAARFTPRASAAAPKPKHAGRECAGLRVRVTDAAAARPYALGIALLHALRGQKGFDWSGVRADHLDWLLGTRSVRLALERGDSVDAILKMDEATIAAFRDDRQAALLY